MYLATILEDRLGDKVEAELIDLRGVKKEYALQHIPGCDIYMHSIYTLDVDEQKEIVRKLREFYPSSKHISGGPHANIFPEDCQKSFDSVVVGDAEESIFRVIKDFENNQLKGFYEQQEVIDVNDYPMPSRRFLPKTTVASKGMVTLRNKSGYDKLYGTTVLFTRGCPYQCAFCAVHSMRNHNPGIRYRTAENIEAEVNYLKNEYGIQGLNLLDEIGVPLDKKQAVLRLEALARTGIKWRGQCRVDGVTPEIAKLLKDSGCIAMGLGVESVSQRSLDLINKKIKLQRSKDTIKLLKENDIETRVYLMLGLPGEPETIVEDTKKFILETDPDVVFLSNFTIRPGTDVYDNKEKYGIKSVETDWTKNNHLFGRYGLEVPTLTFEYNCDTPWGKAPSQEEIIKRYMELQGWLRDRNISSL